jgi:hypothetical protein
MPQQARRNFGVICSVTLLCRIMSIKYNKYEEQDFTLVFSLYYYARIAMSNLKFCRENLGSDPSVG